MSAKLLDETIRVGVSAVEKHSRPTLSLIALVASVSIIVYVIVNFKIGRYT